MDSNNLFGRAQGGAFQAPSDTNKAGMFQSFGQQSSNPPQTAVFGQTVTFGQPSAFSQPTAFGQTTGQTSMFGQSAAFGQVPSLGQGSVFGQSGGLGQTSTPSSTFSTMSQPPAFGQISLGQSSTGFNAPPPSYGQATGKSQTSLFGQTPAFGQTSAFGQPAGFGQRTQGFSLPSGISQASSGSTCTSGSEQPMSFSQSHFGQQLPTTAPSSFGAAQSVVQSRGFGMSEFSFKPSSEAFFKPIFSVSPEPANPQPKPASEQSFDSTSQPASSMDSSGSTSSAFPLITAVKSGPLGFSFSQPAAAPSISAPSANLGQNDPLTSTTASTSTLQFTFSQPAAPTNTSVSAAAAPQPAAVPSSPSSFSFAPKVLQSQPAPPMALFGFAKTPAFGDPKTEAPVTEEGSGEQETTGEGTVFSRLGRSGEQETTGEGTVFSRLGKGTKRKEEPVEASTTPGNPPREEPTQPGADESRHPPKRPLLRSRGPMGSLFRTAMSGLIKSTASPAQKEASKKEEPRQPELREAEMADLPTPSARQSAAPPRTPAPSREVMEKAEETDFPGSVESPDLMAGAQRPGRRAQRGESTDSLGGMSPTDATVLQCKNIPANLNRKDIIDKHFGRFGKVRRIMCRPQKNLVIVHFQDHASAAKAKKRGKLLQGQELLIFWQRKKQSPGEKRGRPLDGVVDDRENQASDSRQGGFQQSPLRRPSPRAPAVSSLVSFSRSSPAKKPSIAKSLQFDSESQQEPGAEGLSSDRPLPSSLLPLIGQLAETAEEKYRLLEQRDKILRQGRPKRTDLDLSKVFVGTCPDMCPEKERYMRETRNQLSAFELVPNTEMVDHVAAIKEYSRSSADQEEPLPHELRPLPVLSMTMDYLVTQVMDHGQDNYRDWYDFVWNRTRGIRKDITQQHLCDPLTVSLMEKCARFHVHCAHHLCEEPMMSFDPKINNENLTKCMQSLKEMYLDLANRGVYCPQEAEFRQYTVLLKLNDGDILREVQQFRDEIRNSPEVKFAVQAFSALNSNNFVRFFKLVKAASYLAGCLLHGYFNQVRTKALWILNIAHTVGSQRSTVFPIEDMVRMLMFHNTAEATDFIQQYGLSISDGMVELSRTAYQGPDLPLPQRKSKAIVVKRTVLIGEVVNGGPLPNPPQHTPVCSFDSHNKYRGTGLLSEPAPSTLTASPMWAAAAPAFTLRPEMKAQPEVEARPQMKPAKLLPESQLLGEPQAIAEPTGPAVQDETGELREPSAASHPAEPQQLFQPVARLQPIRPPSPPPKPEPMYSDEDLQAELELVVEEVLEEVLGEVAKAGADYAMSALNESSGQMEALVSEVVEQVVREVSTSEIQLEQQIIAAEKRKMEEARRKQEHEAFLAQFSASLCSEISQEVLMECIQETAASEIQLALEEKAQHFARCSEEVCSSLVEETLDAEMALLAEDILEAELQRIHKYIKRWRDVVAVRRQLKRQMRSFPAAPCGVDPRFKLQALAPSAPCQPSLEVLARGMVNLGNNGNVALSSTRLLKMRQDNIHQMRVHYHYQQLLSESVWTPLDLLTLVSENIPNPPERIFWKATLLLPSDHESVASLADRILSDWLEVKLGGAEETADTEKQMSGSLRTLCLSNGLRDRGPLTHKVHVSVKVSRGPLTEDGLSKMEEQRELQGSAALLMLLPAPTDPEQGCQDQDVPLLSALLQLKQLQQASPWHCMLPLAILVPGPAGGASDTQKLEQDLMLPTLVEDGLISEYVFIHIPETTSDLQGSEQLSCAVSWLLARAPAPSLLSSQTLVQFVEAGLCREFSSRLYRHRQERAEAGLPYQDPAAVIHLYNAVLAYLAELVSSQCLSSLSWPPGEFVLPDTCDMVPYLGWNSAQHLAWLRAAITSLQIPDWDLPSTTASWPQLCSSIFQYSSQIPARPCSQPLLMSRLENLLERVRMQNQGPSQTAAPGEWEEEEEEKHGPSFDQIPWDEVLALCIDHKLKDWQPPGDPVCEDAVTEDGEILVYFLRDGLKAFEPPAQWLEAVRCTHREKLTETESDKASPGPPAALSLRQRLFQSLLDQPEHSAASLDITHTPSTQELLPHRVLESLKEEKAQSQRCVEQLQRWLKGVDLDSPSLPLFMPSSLLSMPAIMVPSLTVACHDKPSSLMQEEDIDDLSDKAERGCLQSAPVSIAQRLKELKRQILASKEEDMACSLKLTSLLNIVED